MDGHDTVVALALALPVLLVVARAAARRPVRGRLGVALRAPATVAHESAHAVAALALGARVTAFAPFRPRRGPGGAMVLGHVRHTRTGPLASALIAVAPAVLVPAGLWALALALTRAAPGDVPGALADGPPWRAGLLALVAVAVAPGAFPSPGDRLGAGGVAALLALAGTVLGLALLAGGPWAALTLLAWAAVLVLPAAAGALLALALDAAA